MQFAQLGDVVNVASGRRRADSAVVPIKGIVIWRRNISAGSRPLFAFRPSQSNHRVVLEWGFTIESLPVEDT